MISRETTRILAEIYQRIFRKSFKSGTSSYNQRTYYIVDTDALYDFVYDHVYSTWFCNKARKAKSTYSTRPLKDFIMKLHTGEAQIDATPTWSWNERQRLGQRYLADLAEDILNYWHSDNCNQYAKEDTSENIQILLRRLKLDGYVYQGSPLLAPEDDKLDTHEEAGLLESLFQSLNLDNRETASHHLKLTEEHYLAQRWDDAISNSRKFLECVLQEVASAHSNRCKNTKLSSEDYQSPYKIRDYLEHEGLLERKEKEAVAKVYGFLSHTGSHPYMAQKDQARLLRHLALTFSQFVMLRFRGVLEGTT